MNSVGFHVLCVALSSFVMGADINRPEGPTVWFWANAVLLVPNIAGILWRTYE